MKNIACLLCALMLSGCASQVPIEIRTPPPVNPSLSDVQAQPEAFRNHPVRWGGAILSVGNGECETEVEFLAMALDSSGKPVEDSVPLGRFIARVEGFLDPAVHEPGDTATVRGTVETVTERMIGQRAYLYPVVRVHSLYLWPRPSPRYYRRGYYYPYGRFHFGLHYGRGHRFRHHGGFRFGPGFHYHHYH